MPSKQVAMFTEKLHEAVPKYPGNYTNCRTKTTLTVRSVNSL